MKERLNKRIHDQLVRPLKFIGLSIIEKDGFTNRLIVRRQATDYQDLDPLGAGESSDPWYCRQ